MDSDRSAAVGYNKKDQGTTEDTFFERGNIFPLFLCLGRPQWRRRAEVAVSAFYYTFWAMTPREAYIYRS
jgi:hypothetical protein